MPWLPADTETLLVNTGVFRLDLARRDDDPLRGYEALVYSALPVPADSALQSELEKIEFTSGLFVGRRFQRTANTGLGLRGALDRCSILRSGSSTSLLRGALDRLPVTDVGGSRVHLVHSQGTSDASALTYVLMVDPDTLVACSDPGLLSEILQRRRQGAPRLALPESLPEWSSVKETDHIWGLRHFAHDPRDPTTPCGLRPLDIRDPHALGMTFSITDSSAKLTMMTSDRNAAARYRTALGTSLTALFTKGDLLTLTVGYDPSSDQTRQWLFRVETTLLGYVIAL
jgi:hypothetical protein